ncbi:isocitrate/isopropylmalate dehydrogenase family protein [Nocardia stercoris]|uniref:Isocitrate/isopropylmalate dehydrogenase family protein n=1 Tax=Nocardia stercoris TaxID=2483361 RepID=A0A3M2L206_9NOCA|nr:isocitrate/isopropylmalate family dehydrogenase [Nocardia stercoris]RMI29845.1 isocitrate/isopropylmalate dehydrogenase family protein [Nocardia stercoris]
MAEATTALRLGVIEGDGIGPEVVRAARVVVDDAMAAEQLPPVDWVPLPMGQRAIDEFGDPLPESTLAALDGLEGWILGPHDNASYAPRYRTGAPPGGAIRKRFGLFANIRPARAFAGVRAVAPELDLVIVRENSEGFYADRNMAVGSGEFKPTPDVALAVGLITRTACERIAHTALELAATRRKRLTIVHKANVLPLTTGLFRDVCYEVAAGYPGVVVDDEHVDAAAAHLVRAGADYDVLVTENLFGDILSDLAGELSGSLGLAPSLNCSQTQAMAQAVHGAAPTLAGHNRANPVAAISSAAMLLRWISQRHNDSGPARAAERIERSVAATIGAGVATGDLGGQASTGEFTEQVRARLHRW